MAESGPITINIISGVPDDVEETSRRIRDEVIRSMSGSWRRRMPDGYGVPAASVVGYVLACSGAGRVPDDVDFVRNTGTCPTCRRMDLNLRMPGDVVPDHEPLPTAAATRLVAHVLVDPAGRVDFLRALGALLRPYSGEAADYLESYEEDR